MRWSPKSSRAIVAAFVAVCVLFGFSAAVAAEKSEITGTLLNIDRYSGGLKVGMGFSEAIALLGKPYEKKNVPGQRAAGGAAYFATWLLKGYSVDAQFSAESRVVSYGVHWFGGSGAAPEFKSVFAGNFKEESRLGSRSASVAGEAIAISWTKTPVPGTDKFIDVLTVGKVAGAPKAK